MLERQREGIARAKRLGKYKGRAPTARRQAQEIVALKNDGVKPQEIARRLKLSRASVTEYWLKTVHRPPKGQTRPMNRLDERLPLSRAELKERFLQTKAFREYLSHTEQRFENSFDEATVRAELEKRNKLRREANLPPITYEQEVDRLKNVYANDRSTRFYRLGNAMIVEVYGEPTKADFDSNSSAWCFYASKRNVIRELLHEKP